MSQNNASPKHSLQPLKPGQAIRKKQIMYDDPEFLSNFPTVSMYLTQTTYESGSARQLATLTVFLDQGALTLVMNDRDNNRSVFINEASVFSALALLESQLADDSADWRGRSGSQSRKQEIPF